MSSQTFADLDALAQWVWDNREDPGNPCNNFARFGGWVATEFDGGGTAEVIEFIDPVKARLFVHLVRSPNERQRLQGWDMTSLYPSWNHEDDDALAEFPLTITTRKATR